MSFKSFIKPCLGCGQLVFGGYAHEFVGNPRPFLKTIRVGMDITPWQAGNVAGVVVRHPPRLCPRTRETRKALQRETIILQRPAPVGEESPLNELSLLSASLSSFRSKFHFHNVWFLSHFYRFLTLPLMILSTSLKERVTTSTFCFKSVLSLLYSELASFFRERHILSASWHMSYCQDSDQSLLVCVA